MNEVGHAQILAAVEQAGMGGVPSPEASRAGAALGLFSGDGSLTPVGIELLEAGLRREVGAQKDILAAQFLLVPPIRALLDGEWGREIPREQAEKILRYIHPPSRTWDASSFTRLFESLNFAGLVTFNRRNPSIRILAAVPSTTLAASGTLISPDTPYRNKRLLAELVGSAKSRLWWFDPHLNRAALAFAYDRAALGSVTQVRLLSGGRSELTVATIDDYARFKRELNGRSIEVEWRTILDRDEFNEKHDRWIRADDELWNVPPFTAVMQGKYGSLVADPNDVPLDEWWQEGTEISAVKPGE